MKVIWIGLLGLLMTACSALPGSEQLALGRTTEARYRCPDGTVIRARYHVDQKYAELMVGDAADAIALPLAMSGSGTRYSDGAYEWWEHQGTARMTLPNGEVFDGCVKQ